MAGNLAAARTHRDHNRAAAADPSFCRALLLLAVYALIVPGGELLVGADSEQLKTSAVAVLTGLVLPLGLGITAVLAIGGRSCWGGVFVEPPQMRLSGPRWLWLIPVLLALAAVAALGSARWDEWQTDVVLSLILAALLVGVAEELVFRGFLLVGARTRYTECGAFLFTCTLFGLAHGANVLTGQALVPTLLQIAFAGAMGAAFYLLRRFSGVLALPMLAHGLVDVLSFVSAPPA